MDSRRPRIPSFPPMPPMPPLPPMPPMPSMSMAPAMPRRLRKPQISVSYHPGYEVEEFDDYDHDYDYNYDEFAACKPNRRQASEHESDKTVWERSIYDPAKGEGEKGLIYRERAMNVKGPSGERETESRKLRRELEDVKSELDSFNSEHGRGRPIASSPKGSSLQCEPELDRKMRLLKMKGHDDYDPFEPERPSDISWTAASSSRGSNRCIGHYSQSSRSSGRSGLGEFTFSRSRDSFGSSDSDYY